jgi:negative regulator of sigma E activity
MNSVTSDQDSRHAVQLAALLDGELSRESLDILLTQWGRDPGMADEWDAIQVAMAGMRGEQEVAVSTVSTAVFLNALRPSLQSFAHPVTAAVAAVPTGPTEGAPGWRRYGAVISAMGAVLLGWRLVLPVTEPTLAVAQLESTDMASPALISQGDEHLDALLAAHQQLGSTHTLQPSGGFFRQAVYVVSAR